MALPPSLTFANMHLHSTGDQAAPGQETPKSIEASVCGESTELSLSDAGMTPSATSIADSSATISPNIKVKLNAEPKDALIFWPELDSNIEEAHRFTDNVYTFTAMLKRAARNKNIVDVTQFLRGSALQWFQLGVSDVGDHELEQADGTLRLEPFCSLLHAAFGACDLPDMLSTVDLRTRNSTVSSDGRRLLFVRVMDVLEASRHFHDLELGFKILFTNHFLQEMMPGPRAGEGRLRPSYQWGNQSLYQYLARIRRVERGFSPYIASQMETSSDVDTWTDGDDWD